MSETENFYLSLTTVSGVKLPVTGTLFFHVITVDGSTIQDVLPLTSFLFGLQVFKSSLHMLEETGVSAKDTKF